MQESPAQIEKRQKIRSQIVNELEKVKRPGINKLITYLDTSGFYIMPASSSFHLAYPGGLAEHSWNTFIVTNELIDKYGIVVKAETRIICPICHDICKIGAYKYVANKSIKLPDGSWGNGDGYEKDDSFLPIGHGEKSVIMLQNFIRLEQEEILAIRFHMGAWEPGIVENNASMNNYYNQARKKTKLVDLLHIADMIASHIIEE